MSSPISGTKRIFHDLDAPLGASTSAPSKGKETVDSESEGPFEGFPKLKENALPYDDIPYILSTEVGHQKALKSLSQTPPIKKGVLLGFAFEFNYHLLAQRNVKIALICDINQRMLHLYQWVQKTILSSKDRETFIQNFEKELREHQDYYLGEGNIPLEKISKHFQSKSYSWLYEDGRFETIKKLYQENRIKHLNLNLFNNQEFFISLGEWAKKKNYVFDVIYVSNIPEWGILQGGNRIMNMKANLLKLLNRDTFFIDAERENSSGKPKVRIHQFIEAEDLFPLFRSSKPSKKTQKKETAIQSTSGAILAGTSPSEDKDRKAQRQLQF